MRDFHELFMPDMQRWFRDRQQIARCGKSARHIHEGLFSAFSTSPLTVTITARLGRSGVAGGSSTGKGMRISVAVFGASRKGLLGCSTVHGPVGSDGHEGTAWSTRSEPCST